MIKEFKKYKITYLFIILNFIVYLISAFLSSDIIDIDIKVLLNMGALYGPYMVLHSEWWRLFTAMFLHSGMTHLLMNMFSLYLIGRVLESYFERKTYIAIYLFSGLVAGLVSEFMHPVNVAIGASGAIFGVLGAIAGFFLAFRERIKEQSKAFMKDFGIIIIINLVLGFTIPSIDMSAHISGLVVGFIGGFVVSKNPKFIWLYVMLMTLIILGRIFYMHGHYVEAMF